MLNLIYNQKFKRFYYFDIYFNMHYLISTTNFIGTKMNYFYAQY